MSEEKKEVAAPVMQEKTSKVGSFFGWLFTAIVCGAAGWMACDLWPKAPPTQIAMPQNVVTVSIMAAEERDYNLPESFVAHAEAVQTVDLLPQVDGYIKELKFKEGDIVEAGDILYIIDDERYTAVVNQRKADLAAAEAEAHRAQRYFERMKKADSRGVTELERDNAEAASLSSAAAVMQAKANLVVAEYDLKKTVVRAPISGQIGTTAAHICDYVAPSKGALATIVQIDPIRVSFPLTDRNYIAWRRAKVDGTEVKRRMRLILPDGQEYAEKGTWDFDDNKMSADTATILMRLSFPNKNRLLVPNSFVTLLTDFEKPPKFVSVPQSAIFDTQGGNVAVYVLKDDNTVEARVVKTKEMYKGWVPILEGVKAGEKVVISGTSKLGPGMKVVVVEPTGNEDIDPNFQPRIK